MGLFLTLDLLLAAVGMILFKCGTVPGHRKGKKVVPKLTLRHIYIYISISLSIYLSIYIYICCCVRKWVVFFDRSIMFPFMRSKMGRAVSNARKHLFYSVSWG